MILVTGGTGFVGSHLMKRLASERIQTRCLARKTSDIEKLKELGIEVAYGDVLDKESLKKAVEDVETVIHLVGIIVEKKGATFEIIHTRGTKNLIEASKAAGVQLFIYISALGARENARSRYHKTKWEAEREVINSGLEYVIFRPSIMIGEGGEFITMLSRIVRWAPIIPIIDGDSKVQPIYVENTVDCILKSLTDPKTADRIFEIAGPDQITYKELFLTLMEVLDIDRPTFQIPITFMWPAACILEGILENPPITTQQLTMLQEVFNLKLVPLKEALQTFLQPKTREKN
ncbi:MAG: complex I NDUFA9 subunit family protein [Candidatus Methanoperedens sp.]